MLRRSWRMAGCKPEPAGTTGGGDRVGRYGRHRLEPAAHRQRQGADRHDRQRHQDGPRRSRRTRWATFTIEYRDWDDATAAAGQWTAETEDANAKKAVGDPDVMVYIGPSQLRRGKISMPILNQAGLLMISPANTWPGLTKPGKGDPGEPQKSISPPASSNYVRVVPADDLQGTLAAEWAKEMGVKKVYILDDNEVYGKGIATVFNDTCEDLGIEVLGHESIDAKQQEFQLADDDDQVEEPRPDLLRRHDAIQRGPDRQGHGRCRA